jgi:putative YphP/YqiW family bacilliredoxin
MIIIIYRKFAKIKNKKIMYPIELTTPMAKDLTDYGFESLTTADAVTDALSKEEGTVMVVVNSVCGCAAANARPGAKMALDNEKTPDRSVTVFAGVDREATEKAREFMLPYPPSSPSIALFKDGKLVHFLERHHIEGRSAEIIAANLTMAFDRYC